MKKITGALLSAAMSFSMLAGPMAVFADGTSVEEIEQVLENLPDFDTFMAMDQEQQLEIYMEIQDAYDEFLTLSKEQQEEIVNSPKFQEFFEQINQQIEPIETYEPEQIPVEIPLEPSMPALPFDPAVVKDFITGLSFDQVMSFISHSPLIAGTGLQDLQADGIVTQGEIVALLYRIADQIEQKAGDRIPAFIDVDEIVASLIPENYDAQAPLSREQAITLIWKLAGRPEAEDLSGLIDYSGVSENALEAVNWAVASGIVYGENGNLNPSGNALAYQIVLMIQRTIAWAIENHPALAGD